MRTLSHKAALRRNSEGMSTTNLPLFAWAAEETAFVHSNTSIAARAIAKRFGMPPHVARLVAEQARFRSELGQAELEAQWLKQGLIP